MVWYKQVYDDKRDKLWRPLPPTPTSRGCPGVLVMIRQILPTWHMASLKSTLKRFEMWDALRFIRSLQQEHNRNRSKECFMTLDMFKAGIYWCTVSDSIYLYIYIYIFNTCIVCTLSYTLFLRKAWLCPQSQHFLRSSNLSHQIHGCIVLVVPGQRSHTSQCYRCQQ